MGGFFVNPWLIGGLSLAAAPIVIHLLNRRRFRVHHWAAMDFLFEAAVSNRRRLKFEDLILLLLRVIIIVLLVLAVARPLVTGVGSWREDARVVILDDSFSMEVFTPTGAVFEAARQSAINQVQDAIGGAIPVSLHLGSQPEAGTLAVDRTAAAAGLESGSAVLGDIGELRVSDLSLRLDRSVDSLAREANADRSPLFRRVVVVSDFRAVDWLDGNGGLAAPIRAVFENLDNADLRDRFAFQFVDVGRSDVENAAVTDVRVTTPHVLSGVPARILVEVTNFSASTRSLLEGTVSIGKAGLAAFTPLYRIPLPLIESIPPGESVSVEVDSTFEEAGQFLLHVELGHDSLPRDDESFAVVTVQDSIDVVVVDGDPRRDRFSSESGFLVAALAPRGELSTGVRTTVVTRRLSAADIEDADVVLILNRASIEASEWDLLQRRVRDGMGLGFFLGNLVDRDGYHPQRSAASRGPLFPATLGPTRESARAVIRIETPDHPAFEAFRGVEGFSLGELHFDRYHAIEPHAAATVLAVFADRHGTDTPAIVASSLGEGRIVIFNMSADRDWSDWPTDPSYIIALQEWVRHLAPHIADAENSLSGDTITWKVTPGKIYEVVTPSGERRQIESGRDGELPSRLSFADTGRAGFYRITARDRPRDEMGPGLPPGESPTEVTWHACRRARRESDLTPLGEDRLRALLAASPIEFTVGQDVEVDAFMQRQEGELWRWLAGTAGSVLLLELTLAWWFGRRR